MGVGAGQVSHVIMWSRLNSALTRLSRIGSFVNIKSLHPLRVFTERLAGLAVGALAFFSLAPASSAMSFVPNNSEPLLIVAAEEAAPAPEPSPPVTPAGEGDKKQYAKEAVEHFNRGIELNQSGFLNQAATEYRAAIAADPRLEEGWSNLGVIYAAQHSYSKALEAFQKALELRPNRPTTLNGIGTVLYAQKKYEEAKDKWMQAVTVDPTFASAWYNMGNACEGEKKLDDALRSFIQAITISPTLADAHYRIGVILNKEHHYAQAGSFLRRALVLAPEEKWARDAKRILANIDTELAREKDGGTVIQTAGAKSPKTTGERLKIKSTEGSANRRNGLFPNSDAPVTADKRTD